MNFSRRDFVKLGGIAAVASLGFLSSAFGQTTDDVLIQQTAESFRRRIGTEFYMTSNDVSTVATLTDIKDFPHKTDNGESFLMEFEIPLTPKKEDIYRVWHPDLGNFDLFLTKGENRTLLATINRL
jgi:hypothetical protein